MNNTILIGMNNRFSANANKWLFSITGLLFLMNGAWHIYTDNFDPVGVILGVLLIIGGLFYTLYGIFGFTEDSKFAPKVKIDESIIELKKSLWKSSTKLHWSDLSSIKFQPYEIIFHLKDSTKTFSYKSNADVSLSIKNTISVFAERKNIEVIAG